MTKIGQKRTEPRKALRRSGPVSAVSEANSKKMLARLRLNKVGTAAPKKTDRQNLEKLLDDLASEYVRRRALQRVGGCERCLSQKRDYKEIQCSHFIGRSTRQTRWSEDNLSGLCGGCHMYLEHHPNEMVKWFIQTYGQRTYDLLEYQQRGRPKDIDKQGLVIYYRAKIKELLTDE